MAAKFGSKKCTLPFPYYCFEFVSSYYFSTPAKIKESSSSSESLSGSYGSTADLAAASTSQVAEPTETDFLMEHASGDVLQTRSLGWTVTG
jgi:hypothetical protein